MVLGEFLYVAEFNNYRIRAIDLSSGSYAVTTIAGQSAQGNADGIGTVAQFYYPLGVAYHAATDSLLVVENGYHTLRSMALSTKAVTTIAGLGGTTGFADGIGTVARFNQPFGIAVDPNSGKAIIADQNNHALRLVDVSTRNTTKKKQKKMVKHT